ncbi:putative disease resistance protein RGA1 [Cocos nucifera]|uniref:Putative disease resistance protein RGA1 n=1 Tax=Cocos nucifera TaxID=13894 RepID=A0A8K0I1D5_COCNU|nr:putative disease resistance protein RGA1 [Cocos nucifera]
MAETAAVLVASPILEIVIKKLGSGLWKEMGSASSIKKDVEKLQSVLETISDVLEDAENRSIADKALHRWLRNLRDAAFDADDVVDEFRTEALRQNIEKNNCITRKVRDLFSLNNSIIFHHKIARKVKEIRERLDQISEERAKFHLTERSIPERPLERETYSFVIESEIYGRDHDKEEVINFLLYVDTIKDVSVLPIVGLGGVGKTTLAQLVYNDRRIEEQFELRMWVCISKNFDIPRIIRAIIERMMGTNCELSDIEMMQSLLREKLREQKFLLVLDDVWNEEEAEWERLKPLLRGGKKGSKIIVTSRSERVASIMGSFAPLRLQVLSTDDCWTLFRQRAFGLGKGEETSRLVEIGKEIVQKCGGLPLAAKALGSLMSSRRGEVEWLAVKNSEIWKLPTKETGILSALRLSYDHLPSHLKQCFAYCSLFPKDYPIERERLIQLWIAEGLVQPSDNNMDLENIGNQFFNNLLWRSFFQDAEKDSDGKVTVCKMHDLVHDLACCVMGDEAVIMEAGKDTSISHRCRYLSVDLNNGISSESLQLAYKTKKLRSLIFLRHFRDVNIREFIFYVVSNLTYLRVLDLRKTGLKKLSSRISRLKHLRFLDLSETLIQALPDSITSLCNLQVLNLAYCHNLKELPKDMRKMRNLRHLLIVGCRCLTQTPPNLSQLSNLRTLSMFAVGEEDGCSIVELQDLNLIDRSLQIRNLHKVKDPKEAMQANLRAKRNLQSLTLSWNGHSDWVRTPAPTKMEEDVFERLLPHPSLKEVTIRGYMGIRLPTWMLRAELVSTLFSNLVELNLWDLRWCEHLPPLRQLPSLKRLHLSRMDALRKIEEDGGSMSVSLEEFTLSDMPKLEEWRVKPTRESFPHLRLLEIISCPKLTVQPCIPSSVEDLLISGNQMLLSAGSIGELSKLKRLWISNCEVSSLSGWWGGLRYLTALQCLEIRYCDELNCLPEGVMYMSSLRTLSLSDNRNLKSLEGGRREPLFTALCCLTIVNSPTALPEWTSPRSETYRFCTAPSGKAMREAGEARTDPRLLASQIYRRTSRKGGRWRRNQKKDLPSLQNLFASSSLVPLKRTLLVRVMLLFAFVFHCFPWFQLQGNADTFGFIVCSAFPEIYVIFQNLRSAFLDF